MRRVPALSIVLVAIVVASGTAACGSSKKHAAAPTTLATTPTTRPTTTTRVATTTTAPTTDKSAPGDATSTTTGTCAPPVGGSVEKQTSPAPSDVMLLTNVGVTTHGCTDTVVFTFDSNSAQKPGYTVAYQRGPFNQDASGKAISLTGSVFLVVTMQPATGFDFTTNRHTYTGPLRLQPSNGAYVKDVVETGDLEAVTTWVIGLRLEVPFSVQATGAPHHSLQVVIGE